MIEPLLITVALFVILASMLIGSKTGALPALRWMLGSLLALLVALRYDFLASRSASALQPVPTPILAALCLWLLFGAVLYVFRKGCDDYLEPFESETPSIIERLLGAVFGGVTGAVFVAVVVLSAGILAPQLFAERSTLLPVPIEELPVVAYRWVETNLAGISENDPAHTPLPQLRRTPQTPAVFK